MPQWNSRQEASELPPLQHYRLYLEMVPDVPKDATVAVIWCVKLFCVKILCYFPSTELNTVYQLRDIINIFNIHFNSHYKKKIFSHQIKLGMKK